MSGIEDGRARLLEAARRVASAGVASRVSLRDVAKAAGYSPAACYRYFESRERLVDALAVEVCREIVAGALAAAEGQPSPHERLAAAGRVYLNYAIANRGAFDLAFERADADWMAAERGAACMTLADMFGDLAGRQDLGACLWGAVHGLVELMLKGAIDLGQREQGGAVIPSRGETLLRGLLENLSV